MKRFILFFVLVVMLMAIPLLAGAVSTEGEGIITSGISDIGGFSILDIDKEYSVIIFEDSGIDIQIASVNNCGSCHSSIVRTSSHEPGHPAPALIRSGQGLVQRKMLDSLSRIALFGDGTIGYGGSGGM